MDRRSFLYATGLTGLALSVAGCSGGGDDGGDDESGDTGGDDSSSDDSGEQDVGTLINSADENLQTASSQFAEQLNDFDQNDPESFETAGIEQLLDEAQSDLDEARTRATGDQLERVETLDGVLAFFRHFVDAFEELPAVAEGIQTADRQVNNEEWESAISTLEDTEQDVSRANSQFEQARAELEALDSERLDSDTRLDFENLEGNLDELEQLFFGLETIVTSLRQIAEGLQALDAGQSEFEAENYAGAATELGTARERLSTATETLRQADGEVPPEFQPDISELICQAETLTDAVGHLETAAELYEQGEEEEGQQESRAAQQRVSELESCGSGATTSLRIP